MQDLILAGSGFMAGVVLSLILFKCGMSYATDLIYKIKEDIPLEKLGKQVEQDYSD